MKRIFQLLMIMMIGLMIFFVTCVRKRDYIYHFTPHDSLYFNIYTPGKYYTFKTSDGIDSLLIDHTVCVDNYKEWYIDECPPNGTFNPIYYYIGYLIHNGCKDEINLFFTKLHPEKDPELSIVVGERYAMPITDKWNLMPDGHYRDTIVVNDSNSFVKHVLDHCYEFDYFIWHKYKGIVGYKLSDGTVFPAKSKNMDSLVIN